MHGLRNVLNLLFRPLPPPLSLLLLRLRLRLLSLFLRQFQLRLRLLLRLQGRLRGQLQVQLRRTPIKISQSRMTLNASKTTAWHSSLAMVSERSEASQVLTQIRINYHHSTESWKLTTSRNLLQIAVFPPWQSRNHLGHDNGWELCTVYGNMFTNGEFSWTSRTHVC